MLESALFEGIPADDVGAILAGLRRRSYPSGAIVIEEGDVLNEMYVIETGEADVLGTDPSGREQQLGRARPGETVGEMSFLTRRPSSATVRARSDLEVAVFDYAEFEDRTSIHPQLYRNLGTLLSDRLARTNRLLLDRPAGGSILLHDLGAPSLMGYALACSLAWHTREPVMLLVDESDGAEELTVFARAVDGKPPRPGVAHVAVTGSVDAAAQARQQGWAYVLVQSRQPRPESASRSVYLERSSCRDERGTVAVPPLTASDDAALRSGSLPATTDAGRALGRVARRLAGLQVGVALGAGSSKGYAHVGVLSTLEEHNVAIDYVTGTSIGAAVAVMLALGAGAQEMIGYLDQLGSHLFRPAVPVRSVLSSAPLRKKLQSILGDARIEDLPLPLAVVAADLVERREVVFRSGLVWPAVMASVSIPGVYPAVRMGGYTLVDGGVLNPVPSDLVADMGADVVIAVKLSGRVSAGERQEAEAIVPDGKPPQVLEVLTRSYELMQSRIATQTARATVTISPRCDEGVGDGIRGFIRGRRFLDVGSRTAADALPRLGAALPWLRETSV